MCNCELGMVVYTLNHHNTKQWKPVDLCELGISQDYTMSTRLARATQWDSVVNQN